MGDTNELLKKGVIVERKDLIGTILPTSYASPGGSHWKSYSATKVVEIKELSKNSDAEILIKYATSCPDFIFELKTSSPCGWGFAIAFQVSKFEKLLNNDSFLLGARCAEIDARVLLDIITENAPK